MTPRPVVAVVPFGARGRDRRAGAIGRQLARRLVERFADSSIVVRPVFLVAMGEQQADEGYLIFGSTPDVELAATYGQSLGTSHALIGMYRDDDGRSLRVTLVDVAARRAIAEREVAIAPGQLHEAEGELARWLAGALEAAPPAVAEPAANEDAYAALLEGLDEEVNATLLRGTDPGAERDARSRAFAAFTTAARTDPASAAAEERLLVLAAESLERGDEDRAIQALEDVIDGRHDAWRFHYLLGQLRRQVGDAGGAIVALEHTNALQPLRDEDVVVLAELYLAANAAGQAAAHLRRIRTESSAYASAQELLGLLALAKGDTATARASLERAVERGSPSARLQLARTHLASGDADAARRELAEILASDAPPDVLAHARRLHLGVERPDLESELERAGRATVSADGRALADAQESFERVLAYDPAVWEAHFGLGLIARKRDDHVAAAAAFRRALELSPQQPDALHELGVALLASGDERAALEKLDQAATLRPRDAAYVADAGFAHLRAGDLPAARERLLVARALDADDPLTRTYLEELERAEAGDARPN